MNFTEINRYIGFLYQIVRNKFGGNELFSLSLDITDKCNSKCAICGIWKRDPPNELPIEIFKRALQESKYLSKVRLFNIGGGEPFTEPELLMDYVRIIKEHSRYLQIRIVTNGLLPDVIYTTIKRIIETYDVKLGIKVSMDGFGEVYTRIRGIKNGDKKVLETLERLDALRNESSFFKKRLHFGLGFTLTSENLGQIEEVFSLAKKYKIGFFYKPVIQSSIFNNNADKISEFTIDIEKNREKLIEFNNELINYARKYRPLTEWIIYKIFYGYFNEILIDKEKAYRRFKCGFLKDMAYIVPDGTVYGCLANTFKLGNIKGDNFDEIWNQHKELRGKGKKLSCICLNPCDTIPSLLVWKFPFYLT